MVTDQELVRPGPPSSRTGWSPVVTALAIAGPLVVLGLLQWIVALVILTPSVDVTGEPMSFRVTAIASHVVPFVVGCGLIAATWDASRTGRRRLAWVLAGVSIAVGLLPWV